MPALAPRDRIPVAPGRDERPRSLGGLEARRFSQPDGLTLDARIAVTWSRLVASGTAECPVCAGELHAARACGACGSELT